MFYSPRPWPRSCHHVGLMVTMGDQCVIQVKGQYIPTKNFLRLNVCYLHVCQASQANFIYGLVLAKVLSLVTIMPVL